MKYLFAAALLFSITGYAATVRPDAFLCENEAELAVPAQKRWTPDGGASVIGFASTDVRIAEVQLEFARVAGGMAARDNARNDTAGALAKARRLVATCAASGPAPIEATILETRAISGTARVRMPFNGGPAELWVRRQDLSD